MFWKSELEKGLLAWIEKGGSLSDRFSGRDPEVKTLAEAKLVCRALDQALSAAPIEKYGESSFNLHFVIALFRKAATESATQTLASQGLPRLRALVRGYFEKRHVDADLILFVVKILALYGRREDVELIASVARDERCQGEWLWSVVFAEAATHEDNGLPLIEALREPLPGAFCGVAYLDLCNQQANAGKLASHPFDSIAGHATLHAWLASDDAGQVSYAVSAAAALPFLNVSVRGALLDLAQHHRDVTVRIECAWAQAKCGDDRGLDLLAGIAKDPRHAQRAITYLDELGRSDRVPAEARTPASEALAAMANWLAHPNEFGRAPDSVALADSRKIYWPPTEDRRLLSVVRYEYRDQEGKVDAGYGLVGSITWAMMSDESTADFDPMDIYAIHCCWELQMNNDRRAPEERSVATGRRLLAEKNPEFRLRTV